MGEVRRVGPEVQAGGGARVAFDCDEAGGGFDEVEGDLTEIVPSAITMILERNVLPVH